MLQSHELMPLAEGALWWAAQSTLIVSDLHLEKGMGYARGGQYLPPYDTHATLARVTRLMRELNVQRVISLGDSFHNKRSAERLSDDLVTEIRQLTNVCDWIWVEGNHDPEPPEHLGGHCVREFCLGRLVFRHEPTGEAGEIAGHLHPCARVSARGKTLRRRCFVTNGNSLILPAMGAFTGGLNVLDQAFSSALRGGARQVFMMGAERVYAVSENRLVPERMERPRWRL